MIRRAAPWLGLRTALLLALSVLGIGVRANDSDWPLACRLSCYGKYQDEAWTHLPALGVHYVYMQVPAPDAVGPLQKKLQEHGLKALVLGGRCDLSRADFLKEMAPQLQACKSLGVHHLFLSPKHDKIERDEVYARLRRLGELAKRFDVTLVLETHPDLGTNGAVQVETMKAVHHPNVRVNFDTGNITFYNHDTDAAAELARSIDYVATVELKDHGGGYKAWDFPALGQGKTNFEGVFRLLKKHGFHGPMTIEVEGVSGRTLDREQTKQVIADSVAYLRNLARSLDAAGTDSQHARTPR